jgi:hypothetical protein
VHLSSVRDQVAVRQVFDQVVVDVDHHQLENQKDYFQDEVRQVLVHQVLVRQDEVRLMTNFQVVDLVAQCQDEQRHLNRKDYFQVAASVVSRLAEKELVAWEFVEQQKKELRLQVFAERLVSALSV